MNSADLSKILSIGLLGVFSGINLKEQHWLVMSLVLSIITVIEDNN